MKNKLVASLIGIALIALSFPLLWWNEGRTVASDRAQVGTATFVTSVASEQVDAANNGKLVHVTGVANTQERLTDPDFWLSVRAIKIVRKVDMLQWQEVPKKKQITKPDGKPGTVTTYDYDKIWSDKIIDSSKFQFAQGGTTYQNPKNMKHMSKTIDAKKVSLGKFWLGEGLIDKITTSVPINPASIDLKAAARS